MPSKTNQLLELSIVWKFHYASSLAYEKVRLPKREFIVWTATQYFCHRTLKAENKNIQPMNAKCCLIITLHMMIVPNHCLNFT